MNDHLTALAKELDFEHSHEYFDYIIESHVNGQYSQIKDLYKAMDKRSRSEFILYLQYDSNYSEQKELHGYISINC